MAAEMRSNASICTMSLGRCFAGHSLKHKLDMARKYGFRGVELFYEDLVDLATTMPGDDMFSNQLAAAVTIRQLCDHLGISITCLQPFMHYDGLVDRKLHEKRLDNMRFWVRLAHTLQTDLILLPSNNLSSSEVTNDTDLIVNDMIDIAEIGLSSNPVIRFAYEALCWGTRVNTWEASWDVVRRVNRSNFGVCLDTFNIAGRIYADPAVSSGRMHNCDEAIDKSLRRLTSSVHLDKLFLVQLADAERLAQPLDSNHPFYNPEQPARMSWSRNARLFYGETHHGGYLPVKHILDAIVHGLGYSGWMSFEVFNKTLADPGEHIPETMAKRAAQSWMRLEKDMAISTDRLVVVPQRTQAML